MRVTGNNYNASNDSLFGNSSMNNLTQTVTGANKGSSMLSDYAMIKNGSYKKLMKSYYDEVGSDDKATKNAAKSGFSVDDLKKVNKTSYEKKTSSQEDGTIETKDGKVKKNKSFNVDDLKTVNKTKYEKNASGETDKSVDNTKAGETDKSATIKSVDNTKAGETDKSATDKSATDKSVDNTKAGETAKSAGNTKAGETAKSASAKAGDAAKNADTSTKTSKADIIPVEDGKTTGTKATQVDQSYNNSGVGVSMGDAMNKLYSQYI